MKDAKNILESGVWRDTVRKRRYKKQQDADIARAEDERKEAQYLEWAYVIADKAANEAKETP